jgi:hypothetical protein
MPVTVYEIWSKLKNGAWEMVESGCGHIGPSRLAIYRKRHPASEFRLDERRIVQ